MFGHHYNCSVLNKSEEKWKLLKFSLILLRNFFVESSKIKKMTFQKGKKYDNRRQDPGHDSLKQICNCDTIFSFWLCNKTDYK